MTRLTVAAMAFIATVCLPAAACDSAPQAGQGAAPTRLDYLLLASLTDSQQLLSMVGYRPAR